VLRCSFKALTSQKNEKNSVGHGASFERLA